ncbi:hypothetical protein C8Q74DRAFT_1315944 [Fomes fomentarius]|nr:hypothetical protein C8Q74DRAFT_1315944 [Fomes fomentarius]
MSIDIYKLPRESVDVEAIAQEMTRYLKMAAEDTEFLSYDSPRRDKLIAELYSTEGVMPFQYADQIVGDGNPDDYLRAANAAIAELTPPKSFKDRVLRLHIAFPALLVFNQFKFGYALSDHYDLMMQVMKRKAAIMKHWHHHDLPRLFPDRHGNRQVISTPPNQGRLLTPPATRRSATPKVVSAEDIAEYLNSPHMLLKKRFQNSPPQDQDQDCKGEWEMASYSVRVVDGEVEHEYQILLDELGGAVVPMGREEVRFLLMHSTLVG